jgi:hypothetical protein
MPKDGYKQLSIAVPPKHAKVPKRVANAAKKKGQSRSMWMFTHVLEALKKEGC